MLVSIGLFVAFYAACDGANNGKVVRMPSIVRSLYASISNDDLGSYSEPSKVWVYQEHALVLMLSC